MSVLHLQHIRPDSERDIFHLKDKRRYNLGRGSNCEIRILDMKMSRQHCAFEYLDDAWYLIDLGSTNGVKLNESVNEQQALAAGDTVQGAQTVSVLAINEHIDLAPGRAGGIGQRKPRARTHARGHRRNAHRQGRQPLGG